MRTRFFSLLVLLTCMVAEANANEIKKLTDTSYQLSVGDVTMVVDAEHGGKILSYKYKDQEVISQSRWPESFGSTFWTSPQAEWNWPPVPEYDKKPYEAQLDGGVLTLTSQVSEKLKYRVKKQFRIDDSDKSIAITYSIINEDDKTRSVAPWEITRVPNDGVIFFDADVNAITPSGLLDFKAAHGAVWYQADAQEQNRKINADGKGWLAYCANGLLLVKKFDDLKASEPAEGEAEIQVYVNRGKTYIELESQGACRSLKPGESLTMTVKWYLAPTQENVPSGKLLKQVKKISRI